MTTITATIPSFNLSLLDAELAKLNKRSAKLGLDIPPLRYIVTAERAVDHPDDADPTTVRPLWPRKLLLSDIELTGAGPKVEGWTFVAALDLTLSAAIVSTVPGEVCPREYLTHDGSCDHCHTRRQRKATFVLRAEDGTHIAVGRQCLRDFFDANVDAVVRNVSALLKFVGGLEEGFGGCGGVAPDYDPERVLAVAHAVIDVEGWLSKSAAQHSYNEARTTASLVRDVFEPPAGGLAMTMHKQWLATLDLDNPRNVERAQASMAWLAEQEPNSDYIHNLQTMAASPAIPAKMFNFWVSLAGTHRRSLERELERAKAAEETLNEWLPGAELKAKVSANVTLMSIREFDGMYGTTHLYRMRDEDGRIITWFASRAQDVEIGEEFTICGSVKKLDEYRGTKQTVITRAKMLFPETA